MARNFNGSSAFAENANAIVNDVPCTLACWFDVDTAVDAQLVGVGDTSGNDYMRLVSNSSGAVAAQSFDGTTFASGNSDTNSSVGGGWFHAAAVFGSATSRIAYLDGDPGTENTTSVTVTPANIDRTVIGANKNFGTTTLYFDGQIAEAAIWGAALTEAEILALADGCSPLLVRPGSLVAWWPLIGRFSTEIDLVGGYGLTLSGSPSQSSHPRVIYPAGLHAPSSGGSSVPAMIHHYRQLRA